MKYKFILFSPWLMKAQVRNPISLANVVSFGPVSR